MFGLRPGMPGFGGPLITSAWTFLEKKSGTGASASITFSGLDGDADKMYKVIGYIDSSSPTDVRLEFNGATTSMGNLVWGELGTNWGTDSSTASTFLANTQSSHCQLRTLMFAGTSSEWRHSRTRFDASSVAGDINPSHATYEQKTTNVTSIEFFCTAGSWSTTSHLWLYKMTSPDL